MIEQHKEKTPEVKKGETVKVSIWDTAVQEKFQNIVKQYYNGANGVLSFWILFFNFLPLKSQIIRKYN